MPEEYPKKITQVTGVSFSVNDDGLYSIAITARCQSGKQIGLGGGEDLRVEIDGLKFREIPPAAKPQYQDIPPMSDKARIGVGWSIRNRVEDLQWPDTYQEVIIQPSQYSAFDERDQKNRPYVENPFVADNQIDRDAWFHCYEIAGEITEDKVSDPTSGANHYYDDSINPPYWATQETFVIKIDTIFFHKL